MTGSFFDYAVFASGLIFSSSLPTLSETLQNDVEKQQQSEQVEAEKILSNQEKSESDNIQQVENQTEAENKNKTEYSSTYIDKLLISNLTCHLLEKLFK